MRVNRDLAKELEDFARKNNITLTEASKEFAKIIKRSKNKRIVRELKF